MRHDKETPEKKYREGVGIADPTKKFSRICADRALNIA